MTAGGGKMGTAVVCAQKAQKAVVCGPKAQKWSPAARDLFDGLQSNLIDHMGSQQPKKIPMDPKMQKNAYGPKCTRTMGSRGFIRSFILMDTERG